MSHLELFSDACHTDQESKTKGPTAGLGSGFAKRRRRPPYSYTALIAQAILVSKTKQLTLREIYDSINRMYPQICQGPDVGWQNTIRHNLSLNQCFKRIPRHQLSPSQSSRLRGKGSYWTVDVELMDPNTQKRLEEAVASGSAATEADSVDVKDYGHPAKKRAKVMPTDLPSTASTIVEVPTRVHSSAMPSYKPTTNSSPYQFHSRDKIQYVSPANQSSSPYFQSSMNSPISTIPNVPPKHMSSPILKSHFPQSGFNLPPFFPTPSVAPHVLPANNHSHYGRTPLGGGDGSIGRGSGTPGSRSLSASVWDRSLNGLSSFNEDRSGTASVGNPQGIYSNIVHCARSTARADSRSQRQNSHSVLPFDTLPPLGSMSNTSSCSLSPASSVLQLNDTTNTLSTSGVPESAKLSINHLLN